MEKIVPGLEHDNCGTEDCCGDCETADPKKNKKVVALNKKSDYNKDSNQEFAGWGSWSIPDS